VGIEVRFHTFQVALDAFDGARRQLDLAEHKKHLPVAVKATGRLRHYDVPDQTAAFRNQQAMTGREQGPGHNRFHWRSSSGGRGIDRSEQAGANFPVLGFGNGRVIGSRFDPTWRRPGQRFL